MLMKKAQMKKKSMAQRLIGFLGLLALAIVSPFPAQGENEVPEHRAKLQLEAPLGHEVLSPGETYLVKWRNQGWGQQAAQVKLEYSADNGATYVTIVDHYPNTGEYSWKVPHHISARCLVRISEASEPKSPKLSKFRLEYIIRFTVPDARTGNTGTGNLFTVWFGDALNRGARPFIPAITVSKESDGLYYVRFGNRKEKISALNRIEESMTVAFNTEDRSASLSLGSRSNFEDISFNSNISFTPALSIAPGPAAPAGIQVLNVVTFISGFDGRDGWQNHLFTDNFGSLRNDNPSGQNGWKWSEFDSKVKKSPGKPKLVTNHGSVRFKSKRLELVSKDGKECIAVKRFSLPRNSRFDISNQRFEIRPKELMADKKANNEATYPHLSQQQSPANINSNSSNRSASTPQTTRSSTQSTNLKDTYYIYSHDGKLMAEYDHDGNATKYYLYMGNRLIAEYHPQTNKYYYHMTDQINSTRIITDENGDVVFSAAYGPYGDKQKTWVNTYEPKLQFSGKEREIYSGLDYFGARYYDSNRYRFHSVDPIINRQAALFNPQLWNLYAYSRNNPITFFDPDGRDIFEKLKKITGQVAPTGMIPNTMQMEGWSEQKASYDKKVQKAIDIAIVVGAAIVVIEMASSTESSEHTKNARPSTKEKHEKGIARVNKDRGGEKGDVRRRPPRKRPKNWKGPWPPKKKENN
jgi:RHS repeat-associated protein